MACYIHNWLDSAWSITKYKVTLQLFISKLVYACFHEVEQSTHDVIQS